MKIGTVLVVSLKLPKSIAYSFDCGLVCTQSIGFNAAMNFYVPLFIGLRYLRAKRKTQFISFVSAFSLLGMALGTMALITVLSVMNGFDREIKSRLLKIIPHIEIELNGDPTVARTLVPLINQNKNVNSQSDYVASLAMVSYEGRLQGIRLRGIDSNKSFEHFSDLRSSMIIGDLQALQSRSYGIVIGHLTARQLGVTLGDKLSITLPQLQVTPLGVFPRVKRFTLVGVFEVGAQVDQTQAFIHIEDAQRLLRLGDQISGIEINTLDRFNAPQTAAILTETIQLEGLDQVNVVDWSETQGSLFSAVELEKTVVTVLLMIIVLIAAFNIISSLVLMVGDKRFDIAVLRTMGLNRSQVMMIFVIQGTSVGVIGITLGALTGSFLGGYLDKIIAFFEKITGGYVFDPQVFFIAAVPTQLEWQDVALVCSIGFVLSLMATLFPAYQASRVAPAEALRYH